MSFRRRPKGEREGGGDGDDRRDAARKPATSAYGKALGPAPAAPAFKQTREPGRRLRLAVLSPDLRQHSCAYFIEPLLRHLSPEEFERPHNPDRP